MFIIWEARRRRRSQFGPRREETHWRAVLVESVCVDGKPTQQHVADMPWFTENGVAGAAEQRYLWDHIEERLADLGTRISFEDRKAIQAELTKKIGRPPNKTECAQLDKQRETERGREW